jgi:hypothetical protein
MQTLSQSLYFSLFMGCSFLASAMEGDNRELDLSHKGRGEVQVRAAYASHTREEAKQPYLLKENYS